MTNIAYQSIPIRENFEPMVEASAYGFIAEPKYHNSGYTPSKHLFLREGLAKILKDIEQQTLKTHDLRFKIWDPWRPRSLQRVLYNEFRDKLKSRHPEWDDARLAQEVGVYVSPPEGERIPPHATGGTFDLTLCYNGEDLNMGTGFDHFGPEAALDYFEDKGPDITIRNNRRLLKMCLMDAGIASDKDEWWHYDFGNQKWAQALGKREAFYGEVADCEVTSDGSVTCRFLGA